MDFKEKYLYSGKSEGRASTQRVIPDKIDTALSAKIQEIGKLIFNLLDCSGLVRLDVLVKGKEVYCFEMISKTMPFFTAIFGAKDRYVSYMEAKKFVVLRHEEYVKGGVILESTVDFDYANCKAHYQNHLNGQVKELAIPKRLLDVLSGGFYLRMMPWSLGDTSEFDLYADDTIYNFIGLLSASKQIILADNTVHESYLLKPYVFSNGKQLKKVSAEVFFSASGSKRPLHAILKTPLGNVSVELAQTINLPTKGSL